MEKRNNKTNIVYIEDNEIDWELTKSIIDEINKKNNKYSFFPDTREEFDDTRKRVKRLLLGDPIRSDALNDLNNMCNNADILLLDYQLVSSGDRVKLSGIDVYKQLDSNVNSLIYTKSNDTEIERIQDEIKSKSLEDRMGIIVKPEESLLESFLFDEQFDNQMDNQYQQHMDYLDANLEKAISKNH